MLGLEPLIIIRPVIGHAMEATVSLSVSYSSSGSGLFHLLKQTRPVSKSTDDQSSADSTSTVQSTATVSSTIDSTGSGAAQVSAALAIFLSQIGDSETAATLRQANSASSWPATEDSPSLDTLVSATTAANAPPGANSAVSTKGDPNSAQIYSLEQSRGAATSSEGASSTLGASSLLKALDAYALHNAPSAVRLRA